MRIDIRVKYTRTLSQTKSSKFLEKSKSSLVSIKNMTHYFIKISLLSNLYDGQILKVIPVYTGITFERDKHSGNTDIE